MASKERIKRGLNEAKSEKIGDITDFWEYLESLENKQNFAGFKVNKEHGINSSVEETISLLTEKLDDKNWTAFWIALESKNNEFELERYGIVQLDANIYRIGEKKRNKLESKFI